MATQQPFTHYCPDAGVAFTLGECEQCGGPVMEPNAARMRQNDADALVAARMLSIRATLPPEIDVDDLSGESHCGCMMQNAEDFDTGEFSDC